MLNQRSSSIADEKQKESERYEGTDISVLKVDKKSSGVYVIETEIDEEKVVITTRRGKDFYNDGQTWFAESSCGYHEYEAFSLKNLKAMIAVDSY